ncbi:ABC transporter ATP-binding protein [Jiella sp. MQZ9-1]|uniref:ABC transporter ATP-binding protein n=1 Tax=Jiella flava TaxID=2816857 RepID=A0A939FY09_9HYPH|nr:ABC transporter ATP-binding protein [Jiella flava]MBO0662083.1 ABC transporter ATP-binding protein [Jiella flava]MCD2470589.1 ABC transporter ATP-binding protein [Jiella flava]
MTASVRLDSVNKIYAAKAKNPIYAVRDFTIHIEPGEIVALLGSSGCGKTSTLRMIAGFEEVSKGAISIGGREIHKLPPAKRGVAMAFEGYSLYPPLTLRQNIAFALKSEKLGSAETNRRVEEIAGLLELTRHLDRYPSTVSAGQQQRASLGRALVRKADIYLLDEPMGQLEPQLRAVLRGRLKRYLREHGLTAILVTHDQTEANALADRIAVMEGGVLQQFASPADLKEKPANLFVGTFIGEPPMNVYRVEPQIFNGRISLRARGEELFGYEPGTIDDAVVSLLERRNALVVGVRPADVAVSPLNGARGATAKVVSNQWIGDQTHLESAFGDGVIVATLDNRFAARAGEALAVDVPADKLHLFAEDGTALAHGRSLASGGAH